jgi:2-isopropylmalate synthase
MAVANSLAGVEGGVRQIECTINGLGERAGNAALEEVVMAIRTRNDVLPYACNRSSRNTCCGLPSWCRRCRLPGAVQQGHRRQERLRHESGIHQDGMLKNQRPTRS